MNDKPCLSFRDLVQRRNQPPAKKSAPPESPAEPTEIGKVFESRKNSADSQPKRTSVPDKLRISPRTSVAEEIVQQAETIVPSVERKAVAESVREKPRAPQLSPTKSTSQKRSPARAPVPAPKIAQPLPQNSVPVPRPQPRADTPPPPKPRITLAMWLDAMLLRWHVILFVVALWTISAFTLSWWSNLNWKSVAGWTLIGFGGGLIFSLPIALLSEFLDDRLRTAFSVARVTKLPILGSMGNLLMMLPDERNNEGVRLWKALENRLVETNGAALICGVTSSGELEGKSTLVNLLAKTASLNGYRVKIIQARPPRRDSKTRDLSEDATLTELDDSPSRSPLAAQRFGRVQCSLDRMPALEIALEKLRQMPQLLVLVELPSAAVPETVVAAEKLPSVVWLADCNRVRARATKSQMETLRQSRARLVGTVLNHEPRSPLRRRYAHSNS